MNLDDAVRSVATQTPASAPPSPRSEIDQAVQSVIGPRPLNESALRRSLMSAVQANPQQAARASQLAQQVPLPPEMIERNLPEVEQWVQVRDMTNTLANAPRTAKVLGDLPHFARQVRDDVPRMVEIERTFWQGLTEPFRRGFAQGRASFSTVLDELGVFRGLERQQTEAAEAAGIATNPAIDRAIRMRELNREVERFPVPPEIQQGLQAISRAQSFSEGFEAILDNPRAVLEVIQESMGAMAPTLAASVGVGAAVGPAGPVIAGSARFLTALAGSFAVEYGSTIREAMTENGVDMNDALSIANALHDPELMQQAREKAAKRGITVGVFDGMSAAFAGVLLAGARPTALSVGSRVAGELGLQAGFGAAGEGLAQLATDEFKPGEILLEALAEIPTGIIEVPSNYRSTMNLARIMQAAEKAKHDAAKLNQLIKLAEQVQLRELNRGDFNAAMKQIIGEGEGSSIFVDAEVLNQMPAAVLEQLPPSVREQLPEALANSSTVEISLADALTVAPGTPLAEALVEYGRATPEAMSLYEQKQTLSTLNEWMSEEAQRVMQEITAEDAFRASSEAVKQTLLTELNAAGRFSSSVNEAYASWVTAFYSTMAQRVGITPEEMMARYRLRVGSQGRGQGAQVFNASNAAVPDSALYSDTQTLGALSQAYQEGRFDNGQAIRPAELGIGAQQVEQLRAAGLLDAQGLMGRDALAFLVANAPRSDQLAQAGIPDDMARELAQVGNVEEPALREALRFDGPEISDEGPNYRGEGFRLQAIREVPQDEFAENGLMDAGLLGHSGRVVPGTMTYEFQITNDQGLPIGRLISDVDPVDFSIRSIHDISIRPEARGVGGQIVAQLSASSPEPLLIQDIQNGAIGFWQRVGLEQAVEPGADALLYWADVARSLRARGRAPAGLEARTQPEPAGRDGQTGGEVQVEEASAADIAAMFPGLLDGAFQQQPFDGPEAATTPIGGATEIEVDGVMRPALNSEGRPIHWSAEGVRNFWRWFGDSKVVDAEGRPLVVYHGTNQAIGSFDPARIGSRDAGFFGAGFYFTPDENTALDYADTAVEDTGEGEATVMPVYVSLQNPFVWDMSDEGADATRAALASFGIRRDNVRGNSAALSSPRERELFNRAVRAAGFDGVIVRDEDGVQEVVSFGPTQIKSATGNSGAFSSNDPNVLNQSLSSRLPGGRKATENPLDSTLVISWDVAQRDLDTLETNVDAMQGYVNFRKLTGKGSRNVVNRAEAIINHMVDNLLWLHDQMPEEMRQRAEMWYDGGRKTVEAWANRYGISEMQGAAVIAVLSPQNGWFANVSQAERILDMVFGMREFRWDEAMTAEARRISKDGKLNDKMQAAMGKTLGELLETPDLAARWIRVYDQTYNNRAYRVLTPEGGAADYIKTGAGKDATMMWKSFSTIAKAVSVLMDGRAENVFYQIGKEHKVRNFYNNIFDPNSPLGYATIDTHAVAAALLRPLASSDNEVDQAFGGTGSSSTQATGLNGTYPIYWEAYRRAAEARGIQPRQMQSITWEAVRGLFEAAQKAGMKGEANAIWERYKRGEIEQTQAQQEINNLAGGITPPSWTDVPFNDTPSRTYEGPAQQVIDDRGDVGRKESPAAKVMFEVAPDPNDAALTAEWNALDSATKLQVSQDVAAQVVPRVLAELGTSGDFGLQFGGYQGATNPSLALRVARPELTLTAARLLGYALSQDSMMVVSETQTVGSEEVGAITITLPEGYGGADISALYDRLWQLERDGKKLVKGHTTADGQMIILNNTGLDTQELGQMVYDHLGGEFDVATDKVYSAFPEKDSYGYGQTDTQDGASAGQSPAQARPDRLRAEATRLLREALDSRRAAPADAYAQGEVNAGRPEQTGDGRGRAEGRSLAPLEGAPSVPGYHGPDPRLVAVAEQYARDNGIPLRRQSEFVEVDEERARRIADAYAAMEHAPNDPVVAEAYQNLIRQTKAQYDALVAAGYQFWFIDLNREDNQQYASSPWNAMRDVRANQRMGVFPTTDGFGTDAAFDPSDNPLFAETGLSWPVGGPDGPLKPVLANDLFRAVHDAFGHGLEGAGFRARGEENAWQAHVRLFTGSAVGAITSETRGQNSWLNYGPYGEQNRNAKVEDTIFADQKTGLMPEWTWTEGRAGDMPPAETLEQGPRGTFNPATLELVLNENADLSTFLHETGHFFLEVMADLASQPGAPADIQQDMAELLKWFGITGDEQVGGPDAGGELDQRVFHGTPHRGIQKFSTDKIGTGEGAQAFGWGLYFASKREIAEHYRKTLQGVRNAQKYMAAARRVLTEGDNPNWRAYGVATNVGLMDAITAVAGQGPEAMRNATLEVAERMSRSKFDGERADAEATRALADNAELMAALDAEAVGQLYEVEIPEDSEMLLWDAPLGELPEVGRLREIAIEEDLPIQYQKRALHGNLTGEDFYKALSQVLGSDRAASQVLNTYGIKGIKYRAQQISGGAGGGFNYVVFDADDTEIVNQFYQGGNAPQDSTRPAGRTPLEVWNNMTLDQKRKYHERFAESVEQYLMEGKAPSAELQPLFRKFRSWLLNVYRSIKQFLTDKPDAEGMALSPEVRKVFDRMLATDEQIAQAEQVAGLVPDPEATAEAVEQLTARSMRDLRWVINARNKALKRLAGEAKALRNKIVEEVTERANQMPVYAVQRWIKTGTLPDGTQTVGAKINTEALAKMYGDGPATPRRYLATNLLSADGLHPDIIADMFGFESGDAMVRAIVAAEPIAQYIDAEADRLMLERHGDLVDERAVQEAANEAVHNEARARALATELSAQAAMLGQRRDTGRTDASGRPITTSVLLEAAKQYAANVVAKTVLRDIRSRAQQQLAAEARAGKRHTDLTRKGETENAVKAKQDQFLANAAARELQKAQSEVEKILDFFRKVAQGNNEKLVEKGRDPDLVNAARAVLAAYGMMTPQTKRAGEYLEVLKRNDPDMYAVVEPMVRGMLDRAQPLQSLTVDELRALRDEIDAIWHLSRRSRQMEVAGDLVDIEEAGQELRDRMEQIGVPLEIPGERSAITPKQERTRYVQFAKALLRRVEMWAQAKDGKYGGPFLRLIFQPVKDAADRFRADRIEYRRKYQQLLDKVAPALREGKIDAPELNYTFGAGHNGIGHAELLHAILHTGNESNKRKLLLGRGWATENQDGTLDTSRWDAFVERMQAEGYLGKAHYDFAQGVWDLMESMKPAAQKTHRDVFGRYFDEVTATPFVTPYGTYKGGYVPAQADPRIVNDAALRALTEQENENMSYSFPSTNRGFTKSRTEYNRPLMLDLRSLAQHIDKVLLFTHMEPAVRSANKLLRQPVVSQALSRIDPAAYEGMLIPWLNRAGRQVVETPIVGDGKIARVLSAARNRAGMAIMFANVSNTLQQITGLSSAATLVRPGLLRKAAAQYVTDRKQMMQAIIDRSTFMRDRMENEMIAINDAMNDIILDQSAYERAQIWTQKHAYFLQTAFDNVISPIVWTGAYNQGLEQGMTEADAARFADSAVRNTQGSTLPEDISRIESGPAYARIFTQFVSYFNMMANTNGTLLKNVADEMGLKKGAGKALYIATFGLLMPLWVAEAIALAMRGGPEDEDDDDWYLDDWLASVLGMGTIKGMFAMIPFVGAFINAGLNRLNGNPADDRVSLSPAVSLLESTVAAPVSVYKAIAEDGSARTAVRDVATAVSVVTGLPVVAAARPVGYLAGMAQGDIEPTGPVDFARGLVTGTPSPESRQ